MKKQFIIFCITMICFAMALSTAKGGVPVSKPLKSVKSEIAPGCSATYVTLISATHEMQFLVVRSQEGDNYDVYVTVKAAGEETRVSGFFPDNEVTYENNELVVTLNENTAYTFINSKDPQNPVDMSTSGGGGGSVHYSCPCCSGNGGCYVSLDRKGTWGCDANTCVSPGDGSVTCELKTGNITGGGVLLQCAPASVKIHQQ